MTAPGCQPDVEWRDPRLESHPLLRELVAFAIDVDPVNRLDTFGEGLGLFLTPNPPDVRYRTTPDNSVTFARTGGDGVHFGLLCLDHTNTADWPVVMTVPTNFDNPRVVVGATLHEFLCLGYHVGWFPIEQVSYTGGEGAWSDMQRLQNGDPDWLSDKRTRSLITVRKRFALSPWPDVKRRLHELRRDLLPLVQAPPQDE